MIATPPFSGTEVLSALKVTVGAVSSSIIKTVCCCIPFSTLPVTLVISAITVSVASNIESSVPVIVTVPDRLPTGITILLSDAI